MQIDFKALNSYRSDRFILTIFKCRQCKNANIVNFVQYGLSYQINCDDLLHGATLINSK